MEAELLHTYSRINPYDTLILCVRVAVLTAVTLTVPIVLFPVSTIVSALNNYTQAHQPIAFLIKILSFTLTIFHYCQSYYVNKRLNHFMS